MTVKRWLKENTESLVSRTVALTGSTGGLGRELARHLASLGASLILVDRSARRSGEVRDGLIRDFSVSVECVTADLSDIGSVRLATEKLKRLAPDVFIHNAGAYDIPRYKCDTDYDNVFQINFVSPYYIIRELLPTLRARGGRVVVVGSIAHNYSLTDPCDVDFSTRGRASLVYGNAKRYLMFSMYELFAGDGEVSCAVTHPGISATGITAHYPKLLYALIKYPMKIIFMRPRRASLSILRGVFEPTDTDEWIGPRVLDVWGLPRKKRLRTATAEERRRIGECAERIYIHIKKTERE